MALQKTVQLDNGITLDSAYIRVDAMMGSKFGMSFNVDTYVSESAYRDKKGYVSRSTYNFIPSVADGADNFIAQAYAHLKSLDEYKDAENV